ncbi:MAG: YggS family pyridoxal phosphate-dependent enzyme [Rhodocyclaceae bacterium]|nr:YggS family pyridoxal phosphate-dependent enzyme [Rhodocyclaceae bacterium]MBK6908826.1 YggS family pyridoxal phosphate-dependent enzyme [Rhodocyclaceae bacterium]
MTSIPANLQAVVERIMRACAAAGRAPESVALLAVSKTWPVADIRAAASAGQRQFGESYLQEALPKIGALPDLEWHFIGPLQGNKTRPVAEHFAWVHSVDRLKIAQRLSEQRPPGLAPLQVCLQVNVSGEASKSGCPPDEVVALAQAVAPLPRLGLRGLMAIPAPTTDLELQRRVFARLRQLQEAINQLPGMHLDTLSMGMSDDMEAAIMEGATLVRVGTAIFGRRH